MSTPPKATVACRRETPILLNLQAGAIPPPPFLEGAMLTPPQRATVRLPLVAPPGRRSAHTSNPGPVPPCLHRLPLSAAARLSLVASPGGAKPTSPLLERNMSMSPQATISCCRTPSVYCLLRRGPCPRLHSRRDHAHSSTSNHCLPPRAFRLL